MRIIPIQPKLTNTKSLYKTIVQHTKDINIPKNVKEVGALAGFAILGVATSLLIKAYTDNKPSKDINHPVVQLIKKNPKRVRYIEMLSEYPKLSDKYYEMLENTSKEDNNEFAKNILNIFELIIDSYAKKESFEKNKHLFNSLEEQYSEDLENICINFYNNGKNGGSLHQYLNCLSDKTLSSKDLAEWRDFSNFNINDYWKIKDLPQKVKGTFHNLLEKGVINSFRIGKSTKDEANYFYNLDFKNNFPIKDKIKAIMAVHEALYGPISLQPDYRKTSNYNEEDIEVEVFARLRRDKDLDALYNLLKYLNPDSLKQYKYTSQQVKNMNRDSARYLQLRKDIAAAIVGVDFYKSPNAKSLLEAVNLKDQFSGIAESMHAILRIISRIVLKDKSSTDLKKDTETLIERLKQDIEKTFKGKVHCLRYTYSKGSAPCLFLEKTSLGNALKVTINKLGNIHTIFDDARYGTSHKNKTTTPQT